MKVHGWLMGVAALAVPAVAHAERCSDGNEMETDTPPPPETYPGHRERRTPKEDCIERNIYMMPGVLGTYFAPTAGLGPFFGAGVQIAPFQWSHNNDRFGPSQGGLFFNAAFLQSQRAQGTMALFEGGLNASLERNSSRRWLIPYFGGTVGGITQSEIGTHAYVHPFLGVHLYYHRNLMIDGEGGYHFPLDDIDQTKGARANLSARFSLW